MADAKKLARLHRVRTLQLNLTRADEARACDKAASEAALASRITALANAVALNPAAGEAVRPSDAGAVANAGWDRWTPVNAAAIGPLNAPWSGANNFGSIVARANPACTAAVGLAACRAAIPTIRTARSPGRTVTSASRSKRGKLRSNGSLASFSEAPV